MNARCLARLSFLAFAAVAGCAVARPAPPSEPAGVAPISAPAEARFVILQVNDIYRIEGLERGRRGGLGRVRTLRERLEREAGEVLLLHAGDMLFPSVMSKYFRARPMIEALNLLDGEAGAFDRRLVAVFGNHEFDDKDPGVLLGRVAQSDFLWVSSNTRYCTAKGSCAQTFSDRLANVHQTLVLEVGGTRVGILGLTNDAQPRDYVKFEYELPDRRRVVRQALDRLARDGARVIVALTHQDLDQDVLLASEFPEIDIVIGGHEHFFIQRRVGDTWITKADADAKSVIVYEVRVPPAGRREDHRQGGGRVTAAPQRVMLDESFEKDPAIEAEVARWMAELSKVMPDPTKVVATTEHLLEGEEPAVRGRETALGNFLSDALRDRLKTDVAFINGGAIRINDNIPPGPVLNYDLEGIFYFDNAAVAFELTGAELLDVLRTSVAKAHLGHGRFLQVSGIRFRYHVAGSAEDPTYRVEATDVSVRPRGASTWEPLDPARRYSAASLDYLWENGYRDGYALFSKGAGATSPPRIDPGSRIGWRQATEEAIAALPGRRITTAIEGRIVPVRDGP